LRGPSHVNHWTDAGLDQPMAVLYGADNIGLAVRINEGALMQTLLKPQQALIYAMITVSAVDRSMTDAELKRIGSIVRELPVFRDYDDMWLLDESRECAALLSKDGGMRRVLDLVTAGLPENLRETAYVLSAEVAASDQRIASEEIRFLDLLAETLSIDKLTCAALERAATARQQTG
jgi:uncharacterized membrane protein YebE (DUF533 family)